MKELSSPVSTALARRPAVVEPIAAVAVAQGLRFQRRNSRERRYQLEHHLQHLQPCSQRLGLHLDVEA